MRNILDRYRWAKDLRMVASEWRDLASAEVIDSLLALGILLRTPVAESYPCGGRRPGCRRRLVPSIGRDLTPWEGQCTATPKLCATVYLTHEQVEQYSLQHDVFVRAIRDAMGLHGSCKLDDPLTAHMGTCHHGTRTFEVFLTHGREPTVRALLAERMSGGTNRRSLVFVSSAV